MILQLPFATGIASQEYLVAEEGAIRAQEEGCSDWYGDVSLPSDHAHEWSAERRRSLRKLADGLGVRPILHGNFRAPLATEIPEIRAGVVAYVLTELELANDLGAPLIIHGGALVDPRPTESGRWSALQRFLRLVEEVLAAAEKIDVDVWIENLSHYPRFRPFTYVFTRYGDYVAARDFIPDAGFIFDIGHANVSQAPPLRLFHEFRQSIKAISVSDNDGRADSHVGLGRGNAPIADLVGSIKDADWRGVVAFETRGTPVHEGVQALMSYVRSEPEDMIDVDRV
jgi:sugar phosphate isomerase/epimerase